MGLDDLVNKAKDALGDSEQRDQLLDKGADFAKDKLPDHADKVDQARDFIGDKLGGDNK